MSTSIPARDSSHGGPRAGHIPCVICTDLIAPDQYATARVWVDPNGISCCAHAGCLVALGEKEIGLR